MPNCSSFLNLRHVRRRSAIAINAAVAGAAVFAIPSRPTLPRCRHDCGSRGIALHAPPFTLPEDKGQDPATISRLDSPLTKTGLEPSTDVNDGLSQPPWSRRGDPSAWVIFLEPYLPWQLRQSSSHNQSDADKNTQKPLEGLSQLLSQARRQSNIDVLSYIGVQQNRWQAVLWVIRNLLGGSSAGDAFTRPMISSPRTSWSTEGTLDLATQSAIWAEHPKVDPSASAENLETQTRWDYWAIERSSAHVALSQTLQSLGSMVLEAAEPAGDERSYILSHVRQILAFLHHNDSIPDTLYRYDSTEDPIAFARPPTLHLLSSRILTALSDAVWRAQESQVATEAAAVGAQYHYQGFEVPGARYKLKVRELGPEVWMELILWSCVDGGLVKEGAWILEQLRKRIGQNKWSVIDWKAVQKPAGKDNSKNARVDWEGAKDRTGGVVLGRIEGYSGDPPFVQLGERTISSEVVAALIDGLANSIRVGVGNRGHAASTIMDHIAALKNILDRDKFGLGPNSWNQLILRILESGGVNPEVDPGMLERILELAPTYLKELSASNAPISEDESLEVPNYILEQSAASIGLSHRVLRAYIKSGNIRGSLRAFARLQALTDSNKKSSITEFVDRLKRQGRETATEDDSTDQFFNSTMSEVPGFFPQIPLALLASLLDLATEAKTYNFGRWLLRADEVDGPVIPEHLYTSSWMTPSILRFAAATSDAQLLDKVTRALEPPLTQRTLRALLHCQITFRRWDAVEEVLEYARDEEWTGWEVSSAEAAATLAKAILELEATSQHSGDANDDSAKHQSLSRAKDILTRLLHEEFTPPPLKDNSHRAKAQQSLCQILKSISTSLSDLYPTDLDVENEAAKLPIGVFDILLRGVVETQSSIKGRRLWDLYCQPPDPPRQDNVDAGVPRRPRRLDDQKEEDRALAALQRPPARNAVPTDVEKRHIVPDLITLRIITQAAVQERQDLLKNISNDEADKGQDQASVEEVKKQIDARDGLLKWAGEMFRNFGVADDDVDQELGGNLHRRRKRQKPTKSVQSLEGN